MILILASVHEALASAFPLVLLLTGALLHTYAPQHRMIIEERVRDHRMTPSEARWQLAFVRWSVPAMTVLGSLLTLLLLCSLFL